MLQLLCCLFQYTMGGNHSTCFAIGCTSRYSCKSSKLDGWYKKVEGKIFRFLRNPEWYVHNIEQMCMI